MKQMRKTAAAQAEVAETMTAAAIEAALEDTYQSCAHDVPGEWAASSVLDFVVSTRGMYADEWSDEADWATEQSVVDEAVAEFARKYGVSK